MARFTIEQKKISEAMRLLIDLYYRLPETDLEDLFSDEIIQLIAKIFDLTIPNFSPCLYIEQYKFFRYRGSDERIRISEFMIADFKKFMELIHTDISNGIRNFFIISERIVKTHEKTGMNKLSDVEQIQRTDQNKIKHIPLCKIIPPLPKDSNKELETEYLFTRNIILNEPPAEYESFRLQMNSDCSVYWEFDLEKDETISCPGYVDPEISFIGAVNYLLVKYQFLFGSFERVKICKQCDKLFVEKKLGAGEYCSGTCRKKHHDSLEPEEKRLCRGRQNAWIKDKNAKGYLGRVYNVYKDDCLDCSTYEKGGKCPALIEKNRKKLEKLNK